jgi:hypothetical protein
MNQFNRSPRCEKFRGDFRPPPARSNKLFPGQPAAHSEDVDRLDQRQLDVISVAAQGK